MRNTEFFKDKLHWTKLGDSELEEVQADKGCKQQPVLRMKNGACLNTQGKRDENECSGYGVNPVSCYHSTP